jgi:peptidoglycan/xylan/chitin deacetylase (PgdA/CDA1 family)
MMVGTFVLSLDTEIAWGTYDAPRHKAAAFDAYPQLLRRLVNLLNIYEIPATWAVVGHLLLPEGTSTDIPQPHYRFAAQPDTARIAAFPPHWIHAPYLLDALLKMRVAQEIGSHTFTHVLADDPSVTAALFAAQLAEVVRVHTAYGLPPPRALVFPQNRVAHLDLVAEYGFTVYRGVARDWYGRLPATLQRPAHMIDRAFGFPPPTYAPQDCRAEYGLVNLPASQFLLSYDGLRARIPTRARVAQAARGLAGAIQRGEIYHLWFHPFNLGSSDAMFDALTQILTLVYTLREGGVLRTVTMGALAEEITSP